MTWKNEKWLSDVFPGASRIYEEYRHLTRRELAIVSAGVLDLALAQLLTMRLMNHPKEYENFLGLNGDGRAPAGSFGARIQLALLTGVITEEDATILRLIKNIRNQFAHRVRVDFTSPQLLGLTQRLCGAWEGRTRALSFPGFSPEAAANGMSQIRQHLATEPEAGAGLLLSILATYQAYFHRLSEWITRVDDVVSRNKEWQPTSSPLQADDKQEGSPDGSSL